jgi:membrane protein YqaA with SNARE-associated domain
MPLPAQNPTPDTAPRPNLIRRLYQWTLSWSERPGGTRALIGLSFIESSFFPIPPDPLLAALCFGQPKKWWKFALWCTIASVAGGVFGWWIGMQFWHLAQDFFFRVIPGFTPEIFAKVRDLYHENAFMAILGAAFTPIPYKVFTIASGVFEVAFGTLVAASVVGRGARFFLVAGVIRAFGPAIKPHLEKYLEVASIVMFLLGIAGFVAIKWMH